MKIRNILFFQSKRKKKIIENAHLACSRRVDPNVETKFSHLVVGCFPNLTWFINHLMPCRFILGVVVISDPPFSYIAALISQ